MKPVLFVFCILVGTASSHAATDELAAPHAVPTGQVAVTHVFNGSGDSPDPQFGLLELANGKFLGVTQGTGNNQSGSRMIYSMTAAGQVTPIVTFADKSGQLGYHLYEGSGNYQLMQASDGNYYGVSNGELPDLGNIFRLTPSGVYSTVYTFTAAEGGISAGQGALAEGIDGALYGFGGGDGPGGWGIYRVDLRSGAVTRVYYDTSGLFLPVGTPVFANGTVLYGISSVAPYPTQATVFSFDISTSTFTTVAELSTDQAYARQFSDPLVIAPDGSLWFTTIRSNYTQPGCSPDCSEVIQVASGQAQTVYTFPSQPGIEAPVSLLLGSDGNFYGEEYNPLSATQDALFQFNVNTRAVTLYASPSKAGTNPSGGLTLDSQGYLRGTHGAGANATSSGATYLLNLTLPKPIPTLRAFRPATASAGTSITVLGAHFVGVTEVMVGGMPASFKSVGSGVLKFTVPAGAVSGDIAITTAAGTGYSSNSLQVK